MGTASDLTAAAALPLYDFRRPRKISAERMRRLESMYERLANALDAWLSGRLRKHIEVALTAIDFGTFGEFREGLPPSCSAYGVTIKNFEGQEAVVDVSQDLAYLFVDRFFGGDARPAVMERPLTPVERLTVRVVVERISALLAETWQQYATLDFEVTSFESEPAMVQAMRREDEVLVASFDITADQVKAPLRVCLPLAVLEKFFTSGDRRRPRSAVASTAERSASREITEAAIRTMRIDVAVRLPAFEVSLRQLLELPPGTVLSTGLSTDTKLDVFVANTRRYLASPGRVGQRVAVRVMDALDPTVDDNGSAHTPSWNNA